MTNDLRVVLDTGVIVSALILPRSVPRQIVDAVSPTWCMLVSQETVAELEESIRKPKLKRYFSETERLEFLYAYLTAAAEVAVTARITACRDPKDDKFLELAVSGGARVIVSGDADLLSLNPFPAPGPTEIAIVTPREFLDHWLLQSRPRPDC